MSNKANMTLVETINTKHFDNVINNYEKLLHLGYLINTEKNDPNLKRTDGLFTILHNYLNKIEKLNEEFGISTVEYTTPKTASKKYRGRVYPHNGLGVVSMPRQIRNYLLVDNDFNPLYTDIDIKNCHPVIYYQYLIKEENYPQEKLELFRDYIQNREQWIKHFGKDIKTPVIAVINCCEKIMYKPIKDEALNKKYENLMKELWDTQKYLQKKYHLNTEKLKKFIFTKNTEIEKLIIDEAIHWTTHITKASVDVYAYDGFMVKREGNEHFQNDYYIDTLFLPFLSDKAFEKTGYRVEFVRKELDLNMDMIEVINNQNQTLEDLKKLPGSTKVKLPTGKFLGDFITDNLFMDFKEDVFVFKSAMGDGKTHKIYNDINNLRQQGHILTTISILNRISLTDNVRYDYPFTWSYRERKDDTKMIDEFGKSIIICCESLHRLTPRVQKSCDVLILDELMSLLPQLQQKKTHKDNLEINQHHFIGLVKNAKKIVIMDANIDQDTLDYIMKIRGTNLSHVIGWEVEPRKEKNITFYEDEVLMLEVMCEKLKQGKKLFIPNTRAIDFGNGILETLLKKGNPNSKCLYINSSTKDDYKEQIENTELWRNYDNVMISPTISCGVSYVGKEVFDEVFCFFTNISCNPLDSSQMIGRVRYPKTSDIHINIKLCPNQKYKYPNLNRDRVMKMLYQNIDDLYNLSETQIEKKFSYDTFSYEIVNNERTDLFIHNYINQNKVYSLFSYHLREALKNSYVCKFNNVSIFDKPIDKELDKQNKQHVNNAKNETAKAIFTAQNINALQAQALVDSQQHENSKEYLKYIYKCNMGFTSGENLDKFINNNLNQKRDFRVIRGFIDKNVIPTYKKISNLTSNVKYTQDNINPEFQSEPTAGKELTEGKNISGKHPLQILGRNQNYTSPVYDFNIEKISYEIQPYDIPNLKTNEHWEIIKAQKLKSLWIDKIMRSCFTDYTYLYQNMNTTDLQLVSAYDKFKKFYKEHKNRLYDLDLVNTHIKPNPTISEIKQVFNNLLQNVGLIFRTMNSRQVKVNKERQYINDGVILTLIHPVILDERLPVKLESININKDEDDTNTMKKNNYKLTLDTIPIINSNIDDRDYDEEMITRVFTNDFLQKYYNSVFHILKY